MSALIEILDEQIRCAEAMLEALGREHAALVAGDTEVLISVGADKARLVDSLERLELERRNFRDSERGSAQWQTLLALLSSCKQQNLRNGALLKARSEQVQIALDALRGPEPGFYDPSGFKPAARSARPLGTA
jgi:flagellar biosynthesis/type III secretory pathway chaperone